MPKEFFNFNVVSCYIAKVQYVDEPKYDSSESSCEITHMPTNKKEVDITTITFTSENLFLRSTLHNHALFVIGYTKEQKVNRILIDGGFAINILPLKALKELGIPFDELSNSWLTIQNFNQEGKELLDHYVWR